jgi:hypothetical protein
MDITLWLFVPGSFKQPVTVFILVLQRSMGRILVGYGYYNNSWVSDVIALFGPKWYLMN